MTVRRLAEGLWRWTVPHPDWREGSDWDRIVGSVYCETPKAIVLIDPLVPGAGEDRDRFWAALDRDVARLGLPVVVLLTCRWHVRSAGEVRERYAAPVWAPAASGEGFDGLVSGVLGDQGWPVDGIQAYLVDSPAVANAEAVFWIPAHRTLVSGDVLMGGGAGGVRLAPAGWYSRSPAEREWFRRDLAPSLLRVARCGPEMLLPAHGEPVTVGARAALEAALGAS